MTITQQIKILQLLEPALGREKAEQFTEQIEGVINAKFENEARVLTTKDDLQKFTDKIDSRLEKIESRQWTAFFTLVVMILGLYATFIFKH